MMHSTGPTAWLLPARRRPQDPDSTARIGAGNDNARLHLQHGPIDLIIDASGGWGEVELSYQQAVRAFSSVLDELVEQLTLLRKPIHDGLKISRFNSDVARRMFSAAEPFQQSLVTPMIAVAGAVADHILAAMQTGRKLDRIQVNNGGDIALYLSALATCRIGICTVTDPVHASDVITLQAGTGIGGVATSGWQGRSHSLGIADAVTVLASDAASADAAATVIANAIDLPHSNKVQRLAASALSPDSDLGERLVTVAVAPLSESEKTHALQAGHTCALPLLGQGLIKGVYMNLQGSSRVLGTRFDELDLTLASTGT